MAADQERSGEALGAAAWAGEADALQGLPSRFRASCPARPFCPLTATPLRPGSPQSLAPLAERGLPWPGPRPPRPLSQILPCHPWGWFWPRCPQLPGPLSPPPCPLPLAPHCPPLWQPQVRPPGPRAALPGGRRGSRRWGACELGLRGAGAGSPAPCTGRGQKHQAGSPGTWWHRACSAWQSRRLGARPASWRCSHCWGPDRLRGGGAMQGEVRTRTQSCRQGSRSQSRLCGDRGGWNRASARTSNQSFLDKVSSEGGLHG